MLPAMFVRWLAATALLLLSCAPLTARAGFDLRGRWRSPAGVIELVERGEHWVGTVVVPDPACAALPKGTEVFKGELLDDTLSGELRLCLQGPACVAKESWLTMLLLVDPKGGGMSGAVERGGEPCHAAVGPNGGITLRRPRPEVKKAGPRIAAAPAESERTVSSAPLVKKPQALAALKEGEKWLGVGNAERARAEFRRSLALQPTPEGWNGVGVSHYLRNELSEAEKAYREAIALDADFGDAFYNLGCLEAVQQHTDAAFRLIALAFRNGYRGIDELEDDGDLKRLREDKRWQALVDYARKKASGELKVGGSRPPPAGE